MAIKLAVIAALGWTPFAATTIPDASFVMNLLMLLVVLFGAPRFFKSKAAEAELAAKDRTIETHVQSLAAADRKAADLAARAEYLAERSANYQKIATEFQARYDEAAKYSGEHAFRALEKSQAERHLELMAVLSALQEAVGERRRAVLVDPPDSQP